MSIQKVIIDRGWAMYWSAINIIYNKFVIIAIVEKIKSRAELKK